MEIKLIYVSLENHKRLSPLVTNIFNAGLDLLRHRKCYYLWNKNYKKMDLIGSGCLNYDVASTSQSITDATMTSVTTMSIRFYVKFVTKL